MSTSPADGRGQNRQVSWSRRRPKQAAAVYIAAYVLIAAVGGWAVALQGPSLAAVVTATILAAVVLGISLLLVLSICRIATSGGEELAAVFCLSLLFALARPSVFAFVGRWVGLPTAGTRLAESLSVLPGQLLIGNTVLILWAAFLGKLVSRVIKEGKLILPVAIVAALADVITVFWGIVKHVSETAPEVAETFSAAAPVELPEGVYAPILSFVGIGDFLFLSLFFAVAIRYSMRPVRTLWASLAVMLIAPLAFVLVPQDSGMPGLPFLAAAALWANWRHIRFSGEEKRALAIAALLVAAVVAGLWLAFHR